MSDYKTLLTLANVTNGTDDTYYYSFVVDPFRYAVIQCTLSGGSGTVTVSLEASNDNSNWTDITLDRFGVASITASNSFDYDVPITWAYLRVKVVASTGGANDADWTIVVRAIKE